MAAEKDALRRETRLRRSAYGRMGGLRVVLEGFEDRGNRAAVLRTAEAIGMLHVHEINAVGANKGRARGVAHGGEKWLQLHMHESVEDCVAALRALGFTLLAAVPPASDASPSWHASRRKKRRGGGASSGGAGAEDVAGCPLDEAPPSTLAGADSVAVTRTPTPLEEIDWGRSCALVMGNEQHGLSARMLQQCDEGVTIPLWGLTESLNVSVAAAILMHHGRLARMGALRRGEGCDGAALNVEGGDLPDAEAEALLAEYLARGRWHAKGEPELVTDAAFGPHVK